MKRPATAVDQGVRDHRARNIAGWAPLAVLLTAWLLHGCTSPPQQGGGTDPATLSFGIREIDAMPLHVLATNLYSTMPLPSESEMPSSTKLAEMLAGNPNDDFLTFQYGAALLREGDYELALPLFEREYSSGARNVMARLYRGHIMLMSGDYMEGADDIVAHVEMVIGSDPEGLHNSSSAAWLARAGMVYRALGEEELAVQTFGRSLDLNYGAYDAAYFLGIYHADRGDFETAKEWLSQAREHAPPTDPNVIPWKYAILFALGVIAFNQNEHQDAIAFWNEALSVYPEGEDAAAALRLTSGTSSI